MSTKPDGGPAYPVAFTTTPLQGMSLRDYFAANAVAGIFASTEYFNGEWGHSMLAQQAYELADAMLAERAK